MSPMKTSEELWTLVKQKRINKGDTTVEIEVAMTSRNLNDVPATLEWYKGENEASASPDKHSHEHICFSPGEKPKASGPGSTVGGAHNTKSRRAAIYLATYVNLWNGNGRSCSK